MLAVRDFCHKANPLKGHPMSVGQKVLVTGAGGFIGSHLVECLVERGYRVRALVHYNALGRWGWLDHVEESVKQAVEVVAGDVRDVFGVKKAMRGTQVVFHLASLIGIPYSYDSPDSYVDTNTRGTLNVLQAARELGVGKILHTSTSEVYGTAQVVPITERHPVNPQSPYAATKAGADFLAMTFHYSFGLPLVTVRPFNTYGPRQSARAVIPAVITQVLSRPKSVRLGSLHPTRDLTFVKDTVAAFVLAAQSDRCVGEVINVGSNFEIAIGDLAKLIASIAGVDIEIEAEAERRRPALSEVGRLWADNAKAKDLLGWSPRWSLEKGLGETIKWFAGNQNQYRSDRYAV